MISLNRGRNEGLCAKGARESLKTSRRRKRFTSTIWNVTCVIVLNMLIKTSTNALMIFNTTYLNAETWANKHSMWWLVSDRESRIKAFDKLIELYSK